VINDIQERGSRPVSESTQLYANLLDRRLRNRTIAFKHHTNKVPTFEMDTDDGGPLDCPNLRFMSCKQCTAGVHLAVLHRYILHVIQVDVEIVLG
jgi:hypothetical protein